MKNAMSPMLITHADVIKIVDFNMCPICDGRTETVKEGVKKCVPCQLTATISKDKDPETNLPYVAVKRPNPRKVKKDFGWSVRPSLMF